MSRIRCSSSTCARTLIGEEVSEQLDIVPAQVRVHARACALEVRLPSLRGDHQERASVAPADPEPKFDILVRSF
jgi:hypothetical protein